jgi:uncharacterized lipoprotein NlpE involved in copper resistance
MRFSIKIFLLCVLLMGCNNPDDKVVRQEFLAQTKDASIVFVGIGEGDSDHAYYHIRYKVQGNDTLWEDIWLYQKQTSGNWKCINKRGKQKYQQ